MPKRDFKSDDNPLIDDDNPSLSMQEADAILYGATGATINSGRMTAYPIGIFSLSADPTQPRRSVPTSIRDGWNGSAKFVTQLLTRWKAHAEKELSQDIEVAEILKGYDGKRPDIDPKRHPISVTFMELVDLAYSIHSTKLLNPIQIERFGDSGKINSGERRWLAHHLLVMFSDNPKKYQSIPAIDGSLNRWEQAAENCARSDLNAIGYARQLALLIMDMYQGDEGVKFDSFNALVSPGTSDRPFYAQVTDGNIYSIKRGNGDKIQTVMGLSSRAQISQIRRLLKLEDDIWLQADEENWTEGKCRDYLKKDSEEDENQADVLTTVNTSEQKTPSPTVRNEVKIGQVRAMFDDSDVPYIQVLQWVDEHIYHVQMTYANAVKYVDLNQSEILLSWSRLLDYIPTNSPFQDKTLAEDETPIIKAGQIRTMRQGEEYPYMTISKKLPSDDWQILVKNQPWGAKNEQIISTKGILTWWSIILLNEPLPYPENTALKRTPVNPGVAETDKPKGVEVPLGNKIPTYPKSEDDDNWDESINPRATIYKSQPQTDDGDNIPFIATNKNIEYMLSNFSNLASQLDKSGIDMRKQYDKLRIINLWTPASIRERKAVGGKESVKEWLDEVDQALDQIVKAFQAEWEEFVNQIYSVKPDEGDGE